MAFSASDINAAGEAAADALLTDDFAVAERQARRALAMLAATPDSRRGNDSLTWDREAIGKLLNDIAQARGAAAGIRYTKQVKVNPTSTESC